MIVLCDHSPEFKLFIDHSTSEWITESMSWTHEQICLIQSTNEWIIESMSWTQEQIRLIQSTSEWIIKSVSWTQEPNSFDQSTNEWIRLNARTDLWTNQLCHLTNQFVFFLKILLRRVILSKIRHHYFSHEELRQISRFFMDYDLIVIFNKYII